MLNCSVILEESARWYPDKTALICTSTRTRLSHKQLIGKVNQLVNGLRKLGTQKGDTVLVVCPNRVEFPILFYAILKTGAIMVPVNILSKRSELIHYLSDTKAKVMFCIKGSEKLPTDKVGWGLLTKWITAKNLF